MCWFMNRRTFLVVGALEGQELHHQPHVRIMR
jgi:hypothetical protein